MSWQKILAQGFGTVGELLDFLNLPSTISDIDAEKDFKVRVPRSFAARMEPKNPKDPLLLQVLPQKEENNDVEGYLKDPLLEMQRYNPQKGLLHKYKGRVLLTLTGVCAIHCRYCFRRYFSYDENNPGRRGFREILEYIKNDTSIEEVILSGGDPLLATNSHLTEVINGLEQLQHIKILRFHTRIPIVLPERIDLDLLNLLGNTRLKPVIVFHSNHPQELNQDVLRVCNELKQSNCQLLNQSVLLKGVNDDLKTLVTLSKKLFQFGILPYYLHLLDKVKGAAHFDIPLARSLSLYRQLQAELPGYLLPRLAREDAEVGHKTLLI